MKSIRVFIFKASVSAVALGCSLGMAEYYYPPQPAPAPVYMAPQSSPTTVVNTNTNTNTNPNNNVAVAGAIANAPIVPAMQAGIIEEPFYTMKLTPMAGAGGYIGNWSRDVRNNYSLGLATEFTSLSTVSFEVEGGYSNYSLAYDSSLVPPGLPPIRVMHNFDQYTLGANAKFYLIRGVVRPYVGGGMQAVYYSGMQSLQPNGAMLQYNELVGAGQLMAGSDISISRSTAFGIRGSLSVPLIDKPYVPNNGAIVAPGFEEASLISTAYYKIMGTLTIDL